MPSPTRRFMSPADAAEYFTVSLRTLRAMISRGAVTAYRLPGSVRMVIDVDEVEGQMERFRTADGPDAA